MNRHHLHMFGTFVPFVLPIVLFVVAGLVIPSYIGMLSVLSLLLLSALLGIASIGQTLTILIGGIDLSIPAVIGLANVLFALLYAEGYPVVAVVLFVLLVAGAIGVLNGYVSQRLQVSPLVVTLATSSIILGAIWAATRGEMSGRVPAWLTDWVSVVGHTGPVPLPLVVVLWFALSAAVIFMERRTVMGRWIYATGANPVAAALAGVPVRLVWMVAFGISAVTAALAGIMLAGFSGATDPTIGSTYLFTTVASVVIGGTALVGGRGSYARTIAGSLVITELTTLFIGLGLDTSAQQICLGVLILLLVALYGREPHISQKV